MPFTVSALLITGRAGERKTAVAKAVAQCMQIDPRVYTPLLEKRGAASPGVIAFDNVAKLLGVELERAKYFRGRHLTEFVGRCSTAFNVRVITVMEQHWARHHFAYPLAARMCSDIMGIKPAHKDLRREAGMTPDPDVYSGTQFGHGAGSNATRLDFAGCADGCSSAPNLVTCAMHQPAMRSTTPKDVDGAKGE
ncbi:hypothetical protein FIBSPDRAFT_958624 [Athelia psychrophila]|uniref:Uncharacterized protein n=1 Tax=Athelia psychrophila TaxID=1759441 RepID=A0A166EBY7_9AGAM|nr:hypothetical protein FIBSPDRAFT_958624 [Fibularhizoctonia sp. CBS 109695]